MAIIHEERAASREEDSTDKCPSTERTWNHPELLEMIVAHLPRGNIVLCARVCTRFKDIVKTSPIVREAAFGAGLSRLLRVYNDLDNTLATTASEASDLLIVDEITPLGRVDRANGYWRVGVSLISGFDSGPSTASSINVHQQRKVHLVLAKHQSSQEVLEQHAQKDIRQEIDAAFPSASVPLGLEIAIPTHRQVKAEDGTARQVIYRVKASLHPVSLGALYRVTKAIKMATTIPHRRVHGKLDLARGVHGNGLNPQDFALFIETPTWVYEYWKV